MPPAESPPNEKTLIGLVKQDADSEALTALVTQNTGIYYGVIQKYAKSYPNVIKTAELADDRFFNIHRFVMDYNEERGTKLSTYIHHRTNYLCKGILEEKRRDPLYQAGGAYSGSGVNIIEQNSDLYLDTNGNLTQLEDTSSQASVVDNIEQQEQIDKILDAVACLGGDRRFFEVFKLRHFGGNGRTMLTWREVSKKMNLSHEWCRGIYLANIDKAKPNIINLL